MRGWEAGLLVTAALGSLLGAGCGLVRRQAVGTMVPIIEQSVVSVYRDEDLATVEKAVPANLILIRGLCGSDPGNKDLWTLASQLYFSYAMAFVEDEDPEAAKLPYRQGLAMGQTALARMGWFHPEGDLGTFEKGLRKADRDDVPLLFWTLANWVSWINLNLNDPDALAQLPYAEAALRRVLEIDPGFFFGMPHVMLGTLLASKPVIAGGKPETARKEFEQAFEISKGKLLIYKVFYAQSYCRATLDEAGFEAALNEVLAAPDDLEPDYRLLNEVAKRKAARLMERKDDWF
jgi:hypothetical protein